MFTDKIYLLFLFLIPVFVFFFFIVFRKRKKILDLLVSSKNRTLLINVNLNAYKIKYVLLLIGLFFLILAMARPKYGEQKDTIVKKSSEIIIALDISRSMLAQDLKPNRLEKAKMIISRIIEDNPGEKMGLIVFSGVSMWQCPMTYDLQALKMFLQSVEIGILPFGGTQISDAIILASKAVSNKKNVKVMLLISDGEDHDSKIKEAIYTAKKEYIRIISIGIGTHEGAPIPLKDESGIIKDYVKNENNQIVVSKVNFLLLRNVAHETGGQFFDASDKDISADIAKIVKDLDKNRDKIYELSNKIDRFQIFLLLGLMALFIEILFPLKNKMEHEK
ncbi:MAG: VWA domain-containing protein [Endomicrobium sp.]|jgi:Ca-activated chloride channel family protein|nr:VWA domain-containing protein [Endomicrobium sp.]